MEKNRFYVTTAIPYVNAAPHIGFALEIVQADVIARYHRLIGDDTFFLSGTDENALKNVQAANKTKLTVRGFVSRKSRRFEALKAALNISFGNFTRSTGDFIRTTEERHVKGAQKFWQACDRTGDIYKKKYRGLYCVGCEEFKTPKELVDGKCPEHGTVPESVEEENYFFRLSKYQKQLEELIEKDRLKIVPPSRKNEVLSFIKQGLEDFSISRSKERAANWGIPVPDDPTQIIYVWFDALTNYITGLGYAEDEERFKKYWLENPNRVHVIGKGIIRFHAVYWPAMLISAGLPLPTEIFVHGYLTIEGQKISKSKGNVIDPFALVKKYGADPVRYYLLAKFSPFEDGDFSESKLKETYNSDIANGLGNLVRRIESLADKSGVSTSKPEVTIEENYREALENYRFDKALDLIWSKISELNRYIDTRRTWEKEGNELAEDVLYLTSDILSIAFLIEPFLPTTSAKIQEGFGEIPSR